MFEEIREAWRYRDLLTQLVSRNIKVRYKRSVLGIAWTMLNPLLIMAILTLVFSNLFRVTLEHYSVYLLSALVIWNFFSQTTTMAMSELIWGGGLFHHIYVPRTIFALSAVGTGLINLLFSLVPLGIIMVVTGVPLSPYLLLLPIPILLTAMFALGIGLLLSVIAAYFADVVEIYQVVLTAWMYLTPIIYPLDIIPERYRWFFNFNPMYYFVELFRAPVYSGTLPGSFRMLAAIFLAGATLLIGWGYFARKADEFAYHL